jgi:hypothetical protein
MFPLPGAPGSARGARVQDHDALGLAIPLPYQDGSGLEAMTVVALCRAFVSIAGPRRHLVKEALGVPVEIAKAFGLQAIGDHAVEQMARQVIGSLAAEHRMPSCPQAWEIEIAQMRDLDLQFAHWCSHDDHAARRGDFDLPGCCASRETIR